MVEEFPDFKVKKPKGYKGLSPTSSRHQTDFPDDLDSRLNCMLSSFNISAKAVTLYLLEQSISTLGVICNRFKWAYQGSDLDVFDFNVPAIYCDKSLHPIGLLTAEVRQRLASGSERIVGYGLNNTGVRYGLPIAAAFLDFESRHDMTLYPVFGAICKVNHHGTRTPLQRAKILAELRSGPKGETELKKVLDLKPGSDKPDGHNIGYSLEALADSGAIKYQSIKPQKGEGQIEYDLTKPVPSDEVLLNNWRTFSEVIVGICNGLHQEGTALTIKSLTERLPDRYRTREGMYGNVTKVLSELHKKGYAEIKVPASLAKLTPLGKKVVDELIEPLRDVLSDGPTLEEWTKLVPVIRRGLRDYAHRTGQLYYPYSKSFVQAHKEEYQDKIAQYLTNNPDASSDSVSRFIELNRGTTHNFLRDMFRAGVIRRSLSRGVAYYSTI